MNEISQKNQIVNTGYFKGRVKSERVSQKINFNSWALCEHFNVRIAAALWCDIDPYLLDQWGETEYVLVLNTSLFLLAHQIKFDFDSNPEKYSLDQLSSSLKIITERINTGEKAFFEETNKYILSRGQLKDIAVKVGARPEFLFFSNNPIEGEQLINEPIISITKEREITRWLKETWLEEGRPGGTLFFNKLKKYVNTKGSPILEHYSAGKDAGFRWRTSAGTTGTMAKKTVSTKVSNFKKPP